MRFRDLLAIDKEEAVNNIDMATRSKLESFHALSDITKNDQGFNYGGHGDTSLLIVMRNALHHHSDHDLFESWNARIGVNEGVHRLSGAEFLLASTTPEVDALTSRSYYKLSDFYDRLKHLKAEPGAKYRSMWDTELQFSAISKAGVSGRYPADQVYVDIMPAFIEAVRRVRVWLAASGFSPAGDDGRTYFHSFGEPAIAREIGFKRIRML